MVPPEPEYKIDIALLVHMAGCLRADNPLGAIATALLAEQGTGPMLSAPAQQQAWAELCLCSLQQLVHHSDDTEEAVAMFRHVVQRHGGKVIDPESTT